MVNNGLIEHLEVRNKDITLCFTCPNYSKRIRECVSNLMIDETQSETLARKRAYYGQTSEGVAFRKGTFSRTVKMGGFKKMGQQNGMPFSLRIQIIRYM